MTREDIILMSREAGLSMYGMGKDREKFIHYLERFANLVASAEREACAKVAENTKAPFTATAIRARGEA